MGNISQLLHSSSVKNKKPFISGFCHLCENAGGRMGPQWKRGRAASGAQKLSGEGGGGLSPFFPWRKKKNGAFPDTYRGESRKEKEPLFPPPPFLGKDVEAGRERGRCGLWLWFWWRRKWGGSSGDVTLIPPVDPIQLPFYTSEEAAGSINGKEGGQSGDLDALGKEEEKESFPIFFVCVVRSSSVVSCSFSFRNR